MQLVRESVAALIWRFSANFGGPALPSLQSFRRIRTSAQQPISTNSYCAINDVFVINTRGVVRIYILNREGRGCYIVLQVSRIYFMLSTQILTLLLYMDDIFDVYDIDIVLLSDVMHQRKRARTGGCSWSGSQWQCSYGVSVPTSGGQLFRRFNLSDLFAPAFNSSYPPIAIALSTTCL